MAVAIHLLKSLNFFHFPISSGAKMAASCLFD